MRATRRRTDSEISQGGQRLAGRAVSPRGRAWADGHPDLTTEAPEGVECQIVDGDPLIRTALESGLLVGAGDVRVRLC
jgi:hypothetical protein